MTRLYKHLRVHQIFGANTDVGKTVLTTALCRASASRQKRVFYLKPVSTGAPMDADDGHITQFTAQFRNRVQTHCLFRYSDPVSPHLAVQLSQQAAVSDEAFVRSIAKHVETCAQSTMEPAVMYIETAGGVHSPVISGSTQVNAYRSLYLPTILVGDPNLGGISSTISAYESLLLRGYKIDGVAMFRDSYYRNYEYLAQYFSEQRIPFYSVAHPPNKLENTEENYKETQRYYSQMTDGPGGGEILLLDERLDNAHSQRLEELQSMSKRTLDTVWWPFVQHGLVQGQKDVTVIDSAHGDFFSVFEKSPGTADSPESLLSHKFDGSASWWTQALGHGHASLTLAAARAAGRYGHVIFPQASHLPALHLAERLVHKGPGAGWATRAYFSDDGSTGMEIALKMAFRAFSKREGWRKHVDPELGVLGLKGSYHGDTIGAMDACEEGIFTCEWHHAKGYWFEPPTVGIKAGGVTVTLPQAIFASDGTPNIRFDSLAAVYDVQARLRSPLAQQYKKFISNSLSRIQRPGQPKLAALVIEPLVMGAGGMIFVDPLFQRVLVDVVRASGAHEADSGMKTVAWQGIPVIFDEVFVGLYRLGMRTCSSVLGVNPDIAVYAKILTGGLIPMAVTLATDSIYQAFMGDTKAEALLHGHSYTAHPIGCEVANEAIDIIEKMSGSDQWAAAKRDWRGTESPSDTHSSSVWSFWDSAFVNALSRDPQIEETMTLGTVLAFKLRDNTRGYGSASAQTALSFLQRVLILDGSSPTPFGVHFRTLGNVAYFMCSLNTRPETLRALEGTILKGLQTKAP
ncbi:PLP-dependent transferase [Ramaria rubella]|nr:PLP-dependent transferase [Ramaria rubella]